MGDRSKDRVAVVTGAGRGIGRGIALALAAEGARVVVNDLGCEVDGSGASQIPADEVVREIREQGGIAVPNYESVATYSGGEKIIKAALDNFGKIDILVNNAGILRDRMVFNMTEQEWDAVLKVHLYGTFNCSRHAAVLMKQQRSGRIISLTSSSGLRGNAGQANYGAAKAGIAGFTRVCARDLGRYGITVNAIAPGADTRMTLTPELIAAREIRAQMTGVEVGKEDPEDVAPVVVYLCTDDAAHINGCIFGARDGLISLYTDPTPAKSIYKQGRWTLDELLHIMPMTLAAGLVNPPEAGRD